MLHWEHTHAISTPGFTYRALTSSGPPSQTVQLPNATHAPPRQKRETHAPHNPAHATPAESHTHTVSPSSAIARHYTRNILSYGY